VSIGQTKRARRAIMAVLQPLTGTRATGTATVSLASGQTADVCIPANSHAFPIPESAAGVGQVDDQRMLRTTAPIIVTSAGAKLVPVTSMMGGAWHNALGAGTRLVWDPPIPGIETHSSLSAAMSGGANALEVPGSNGRMLPGFVRDVSSSTDIAATDVAKDLFMARLSARIPSVVVSWQGSDEGEIKGRGQRQRPDRWFLFIVTDTRKGEEPRRDSGEDIMDAVEGLIGDRKGVDGYRFSDPPAIVTGRRRLASTESSTVYVVSVSTYSSVRRTDLRVDTVPGMTADAATPGAGETWDTLRLQGQTTDDPPFVITGPIVIDQLQDAFSEGFTDGFS